MLSGGRGYESCNAHVPVNVARLDGSNPCQDCCDGRERRWMETPIKRCLLCLQEKRLRELTSLSAYCRPGRSTMMRQAGGAAFGRGIPEKGIKVNPEKA